MWRYNMGLFDKIKGMVGSDDLDYNEYDGDLFGDDIPGQDPIAGPSGNAGAAYDAPYDNGYAAYEQPQQQPQSSRAPSGALELKVVKPTHFEEVNRIADHLLNRRTVVLNLENTNKETARRLIDFLSGVAYSIDGQLKRVANNTFVITPHNVDVSGEQLHTPEPQAATESTVSEGNIYNGEI